MKRIFRKEERLCSRRLINSLFHNGSSFIVYPFRIVYLPVAEELPVGVQVLISVPKRKMKRAVMRNKIKRKIREVYRLQRSEILLSKIQPQSVNLLLAIQYLSDKEIPFNEYMLKMKESLNQLVHEVC
ncbi:ribonuclease P protein component [Sphingobacterium sp. SGG-5]|uniref:ribonuclease P protein component n=1 Tax=Sphingobacterium sp. SGG-5 TaxID=2710881 RepID=UPI0013EA4451|nr:ribonuclease P protein component [Sphingobacterium sp. SGG-5]NGM60347.1 ribonuclease P protein component [Sphingobacterium sp. SGG-5]